jgi:UDP-N-acetylmuramate--alanine ligase
MKNENKTVMTKEQLMNWIQKNYSKKVNKEFGELLITAGAGDIDTMVEPVRTAIEGI